MDKVRVINNVYCEFKRRFTIERCPELFEAMRLAQEEHFPHPLGHFAILYTPVPKKSRPKIMLVGNNPSWFVDVKKIGSQMMKKKRLR